MNTFDLEAVLNVYHCKSYAEAAHQLSISASSLSKTISHLEDELGVTLFERATKSRPVELTDVGRALIHHIQNAADSCHALKQQAVQLRKNTYYDLKIGYIPSIGTYGEGKLLSRFALDNPDIHLQLYPGRSNILFDRLYAGTLDCLLIPISEWDLESESGLPERLYHPSVTARVVRCVDTMMLATSYESPISQRTQFSAADVPMLKGKTVLINGKSTYTDHIDRVMRQLNIPSAEGIRTQTIDFDRPGTIYTLLLDNPDVIAPIISVPMTRKRAWACIPVAGWTTKTWLYFVYANANRSKALKMFQSAVTEFIDVLGSTGYTVKL